VVWHWLNNEGGGSLNKREKASIAVLQTHVMYIKKAIDEIKEGIEENRKTLQSHSVKLAALDKGLNNHLSQHRRDLTLLGIVVSIIAFVISTLTRFI